jgi:hypothetical protein
MGNNVFSAWLRNSLRLLTVLVHFPHEMRSMIIILFCPSPALFVEAAGLGQVTSTRRS